MRLILLALTLCGLCAAPLHAACQGQDLSTTLTAEERATLETRLAATPYPEGNHWRATRDGEVLHLIGTMHLGDDRLDGPVARLVPLVEGAALLLLEMTQVEQRQLEQALATDTDMLLLPDSTLPELLPEEDWDQLAEAMRARGMPPFMAARMRPWYVSMLLAIPPCMTGQLTERNGLDARLEAAAGAAGVPTRALEPYDIGFAAFADMPFDTQLLMIRSALATPDTAEDLFETVLSAYFAQTHAAGQIALEVLSPRLTPLTEAENALVFEQLDAALISGRNRAWIPEILAALDDTDGPVVAAFGAAHLPGETGVLKLLEQEGFTLERLPF
ncbi:TraB/GumN family protein [Maliponia aquimaris]|uniref:TraB family protein n=1 Tax=Maliponia aquimaris TaxID=1673631 RepID=A0A238KA28_9RHOB|nr:TraB/GumN family protein [Maliponia aquimaris]SMX38942.1 TraB family protein [Maliponia aquimaris]